MNSYHDKLSVLRASSLIRLATELHNQEWIKILISEYVFAVNVVMVINIAIHKAFISHDLVDKLLIAKMSSTERTSIF